MKKEHGVSTSTDFLLKNVNPAKSLTPEQTTVRSGGRRHPVKELDAGFLILKKREAQMRENPTPTEAYFKKLLSQQKFHFYFQKVLGRYIVDFLIIEKRLIIEIDGEFHNSDISQQTYDVNRDEFLNSHGFGLWRFPNSKIFRDGDKIISQIINYQPGYKKPKFCRTLKILGPKNNPIEVFRRNLVFELNRNLHKVVTWRYFRGRRPNFINQ